MSGDINPSKSTDYGQLTIVELKKLLRQRGARVTGRKSELVDRSIHHSARRLCNFLHHRCNIGVRRPFETAKTSKLFWASTEALLRLTTALDSSSLLQAYTAASIVVVVLQAPHVRAPTPTYRTTVSAGATVVVCAQHVHQQQQLFSWPSGGHLRPPPTAPTAESSAATEAAASARLGRLFADSRRAVVVARVRNIATF
uniref:SAP domain-containing protein n=1 Tax=Trichogramma kaykai TaxID=54128 RepID=A0ABD2WCH3_9HYME